MYKTSELGLIISFHLLGVMPISAVLLDGQKIEFTYLLDQTSDDIIKAYYEPSRQSLRFHPANVIAATRFVKTQMNEYKGNQQAA